MILDELSTFTRGVDTSANSGTNYTDILDWGTSGNSNGKGDSTDFDPSHRTAGHHGDDVQRSLSWFARACTAVTGPVSVTWQTSDDPNFAPGNVTDLQTVDSKAEVAKGTFIVNGLPLPRGLKRYQRLNIVATAESKSGTVEAVVADAMGA